MGSRAGLNLIGLCNAGTLATSPANPEVIGLRNEAKLTVEPFKTVKDYRERELPNMQNFKLEADSLQVRMKQLQNLIGFLNLNADIEIRTERQSALTTSADIFQFTGDNKLGVGFEYMITADKRSCKVMLEGATEEENAKALIDAADSNTPSAFGVSGEGADFTLYKAPFYLAFEFPSGVEIVPREDIIDRKVSIKTKSKKDIYNRDIVDYLTYELEITGRKAAITDIVTMFNKTLGAAITIVEGNDAAGTHYDSFEFAAGVLTKTQVIEIDDEERLMRVKFTGNAPIYDILWDFGATGGGDVAADGIAGGTMSVGY